MLITASAAVVFGLITIILVRTQRANAMTAVPIWLSGFTAASTGLAGPVNQGLTALAHLLASLH
ncbi:hypothetical protein GCM10010495_14570 [Kitasatospora herbaricolor]|uniref:hypothetical protein n=1 Tax=Kitasatospora herbaricolor TaxID=68217 RepID=UPI00174BBE35|nr:hypothetical protein [Kitasatospora herbaricolor]MDQ0309264.1 hypothetical protein [Kitasatospora herbaricolor]GGV04005.1 hypothetical protein GCM10010495_14570 [Kitasatospora herbaricolor]